MLQNFLHSTYIWVRSRNCGCLVTWFCYQLIAKPGNKTATPSWPDPYILSVINVKDCYTYLWLFFCGNKVLLIKENITVDMIEHNPFDLIMRRIPNWNIAVYICLWSCDSDLHNSWFELAIIIKTAATSKMIKRRNDSYLTFENSVGNGSICVIAFASVTLAMILKIQSYHDANFVIIGATRCCHWCNLCCQWQQSWQNVLICGIPKWFLNKKFKNDTGVHHPSHTS